MSLTLKQRKENALKKIEKLGILQISEFHTIDELEEIIEIVEETNKKVNWDAILKEHKEILRRGPSK